MLRYRHDSVQIASMDALRRDSRKQARQALRWSVHRPTPGNVCAAGLRNRGRRENRSKRNHIKAVSANARRATQEAHRGHHGGVRSPPSVIPIAWPTMAGILAPLREREFSTLKTIGPGADISPRCLKLRAAALGMRAAGRFRRWVTGVSGRFTQESGGQSSLPMAKVTATSIPIYRY